MLSSSVVKRLDDLHSLDTGPMISSGAPVTRITKSGDRATNHYSGLIY